MKWSHLAIGCAVCALLCLSSEGVETKVEWSVRSYACPGDLLIDGFVVDGKGRIKLPKVPEASASTDEMKVYIKQSSAVFREYLRELPLGTLVVLDSVRHSLAARTTVEGHVAIESMIETWTSGMPRVVAMQLNVVDCPLKEMDGLLKDVAGEDDHTALLNRLETAGAKVVASAKLETKSGQRATIEMVRKMEHVTEFGARADGSTEAVSRELEPMGIQFEVDPVVGSDGETIDLNLGLTQAGATEGMRQVPVGRLAGKRMEVSVVDFERESWNTATTLKSGQSRLVCGWQRTDSDVFRGCFLTVHCPKVQLNQDDRAAGWLKTLGDAVEPVPSVVKKVDSGLELLSGMVVKKFRVGRDFLSMGGASPAASPADPFGGRAPEPTFMLRATVEDVLKQQGIVFPSGASATFDVKAGLLTVVNTPDQMALVEAFMDSIQGSPPAWVQFRLLVMEAGSAVVTKVVRESLGTTDHGVAWEVLQAEVAAGRGRVVEVATIETKSGQRCVMESGLQYARVMANLSSQVPEVKGDKASVLVTGVPVAEMVATVEREMVGLRWEIDSVLGADGYTIDLNMAVKRQSRGPLERFEAPVAGDGVVRVDAPTVDFHPLELTTAFTTVNGMWRMIGTWQPVGADGKLDPAVMQAVFVQASVVRMEEK